MFGAGLGEVLFYLSRQSSSSDEMSLPYFPNVANVLEMEPYLLLKFSPKK